MTVGKEEQAHHRQLGQEEIMQQIDVERTAPDELKALSETCLPEKRLFMPEEHEDYRQQQEHGQRMGQRCPLHMQRVPLDHFQRHHYRQRQHHRVEPAGVHQPLRLIPVTVHDGAIEEEGEIAEHLHQAGVVEELILWPLVSQCP